MKKQPSLAATIACFAVLTVAGTSAAEPPDLYVIELQVVATSHKWTLDARSVHTAEDKTPLGTAESLTTVGGILSMKIGDLEVDLESNEMWAGEANPPEGSGIEVLTAPRIVVPAGEEAQLRIGSAAQFLELRDNDCFTVETLPPDASPGFNLELVAEGGPPEEDGAETVSLDLTLRVATIGERQPLPGVTLDVGRPKILTQEINSRYTYPLERWNLVTSHISRDPTEPDGEKLLVLIRVTRPPSAS